MNPSKGKEKLKEPIRKAIKTHPQYSQLENIFSELKAKFSIQKPS